MTTLGIDTGNTSLVYEGTSNWGYPLWPAPTLVAVAIVDESSKTLKPSRNQQNVSTMNYVLVDLGYDPTSRVRKGRLFKCFDGTQPSQWHVQPHPAILSERRMINADGVIKKSLATYCDFRLTIDLKSHSIIRPMFILGNEQDFTIWSLVDVESTVSGEALVYLKSRKVFGALPELSKDAVPSECFERVVEKLNTLAEDLYRAGPESVIDRCREAVTAILSGYLQEEGVSPPGKDLGDLAKAYDNFNKQNQVIAGQARTIARLHSRGKNAEQEKRGVRLPTETDAQLAVQAVGMILRDLGWVK